MDLGIAGRTALVTGADSGIGWHTAQALLREGVELVLTDLDQERLDAAAVRLGAERGVHAFAAELRSEDEVRRLARAVESTVGGLDIVVHAAGVTGATGSFDEIDEAGWATTIDTDLLAAARLARVFLPVLRAGGWGRLVFVASEDAVQIYPDEIPYCVSKAGVLALAKGLSKTAARDGVLVNCVSPAFIATPMTDAMMSDRAAQRGTSFDEAIESFLDEERPGIALRRRGRPEEVADVIAFLCSERASFVNGANWRVDAGSVQTV